MLCEICKHSTEWHYHNSQHRNTSIGVYKCAFVIGAPIVCGCDHLKNKELELDVVIE